MNIWTRISKTLVRLPLAIPVFLLVSAALPSGDVIAQTTTQPASGSRSPLITNVFGTTTGGALQNRRPGIQVQQGIAVHNGNGSFDGNVVEEPPTFIEDTVEQVMLAVLDGFTQILNAVGLLIGTAGGNLDGLLGGLPGIGGFPPLTDGGTGSIPIQ